jgi:hypothetical protein
VLRLNPEKIIELVRNVLDWRVEYQPFENDELTDQETVKHHVGMAIEDIRDGLWEMIKEAKRGKS